MSQPNAPVSPLAPLDRDWWRGAVIYQIYPRSFMDSNGDGVGDLPGITARLDYVASLGVDAIWISPFFTSPMRDFGYDIADYRDVDPIFGTLADFDRLLARAHELGLRVLIDQVLSHTSDEHAWFKESRASRDNARADWYVWTDPLPDGTPPNNWLSIFGGSAWQWDTRRQQYYLHNFLASQPDLNLHSAALQNQLLDEVRFWLARGVDGFRFDACNFYFHDERLRDNPPWGARPRGDYSTPLTNPYSRQRHLYDKTRPENLPFLRRLRALLDEYGATTSVGEIGDDDALAVMADYTSGGDKLHMAYTFNLLGDALSGAYIRGVVETVEAGIGDGWPCWSIGNHDAPRVVTRMGGADAPPALASVLLALMLSLRGSACIYQGEELGLPEAEIPFERLQDPYGIAFWPEFKGRDGCRTPMPWDGRAPHAGFSTGEPWLPMAGQHRSRAAALQAVQADSVLNRTRRFLQWRKTQPLLTGGDIRFHDAPDNCLLLSRRGGGTALVAAFNLSAVPVVLACPRAGAVDVEGHGMGGALRDGDIALPPFGAWFGAAAMVE
ncbi:alpha-amylase family glycosyl hydrolase [Pseudoduganella namucuonensis]|uniref:Alpha-glucosidase n=1 Tax=Pseudoduganella namucuonensis TaxID=1035707 RepID=A0A1I7JXC7_9BURK|nr:alpha-amylase family glycosyl hydrolase [Pseudoduganella namucuonensis]SFU89824.1 alpha-glucosidase [Pseudoduganella namucuonensis]